MAAQNNNTPTVIDSSSVFYIHPSDASVNQLVSVKFNGNGYNNWKRSMMLMLSVKNKLSFVNGTVVVPVPGTDEYKAWERCNDLVISWILFNLDETIACSVLFLKTARDIWKDLEDRFGYASITQIYSLEQTLSELTQGQQSVSEFYTKMKTLWDSIDDTQPLPVCVCPTTTCTCNLTGKIHQMQQTQRVLQFLMKLNDHFSAVRANILMMNPLPSLTQAYRIVAQEETHKEISQNTAVDSLAFATERKYHSQGQAQTVRPQIFNNSQRSGSFTGNFKRPAKPQNNYYCTHCKMAWHSLERCFKIHGFPPNFKGNKDKRVAAMAHNQQDITDASDVQNLNTNQLSTEQYQQLMELLGKHSISENKKENTISGHALLAGPFAERSTTASW
ncbi:uncharacterized protein LOC141683044 [Apium graveolens]|uniref:uncharacterized protein LOC141683044 n=1 Tax=Apium graveolens TaxID=4045 RepID=UPI003D7BCD72